MKQKFAVWFITFAVLFFYAGMVSAQDSRKGLDPELFGAYDRKGADSNESKKEKK